MEKQTLVLIALVAGAFAGPITNDKGACAKTCSESSRFNYETGKTYEFTYKADTLTTLAGASEEQSSLHIRAIADIEVHSPCDFVLRLRDTRLEESDPRDQSKRLPAENSADFARALQAESLNFAFQDGRVETLCAAPNEPVWVLNIKRGILSAFQNNMPEAEGTHSVKETDVAGNCKSVYSVSEKKENSITMKRSKNLLGCTERNNHVTAFQATPYKVESAVQSLPLMKSHHDCVQRVEAGVLHSAECVEKHIFRPFSNSDNGALTHAVQKLELLRHGHRRHHKHRGPHRRTDLLFEHSDAQDGQSMERAKAKATLEQICASADIRPKTAQLFSQLVYNLRQLDAPSLSELHREVRANKVCSTNHQQAQKFFLDAIPMVGTSASLGVIRDLVLNGEVSGTQAEQWLTSLAFVAKPNADMIREIRPLVEAPNPSATTLLSVSALANTFCRQSGSCADNMDIQDIVRLLTANLRTHCNNADRDLVLRSLKALGNLGQGQQVVATLARCAAAASNPIDVRVAAMTASRAMPCSQNRRAFLDTFANAEEDSEVRINAYLAAMACPSRDIMPVVRRMLEKEEVNQVGSFVWTHLTNLQETNDPFKEEIRDIVNDQELKKEFDMDKRKFSRNYEGSMFFNSINTGAKVESNLIWSSKSYVPRSAMLNLTVDLFGHSVNLMEMGGRVEGMEHLIESLFGPEGYFPENAVSTALKRARRSTDSTDKFDRVEDRFAAQAENRPRGSAYMKVFGNELRYIDLDSSSMSNPTDNINLLDILAKLARNQEADFSKSFMFLDSTLTVPTITGMPMKLSVNGTATVKLALGGKMDLRQARANPININIDGYLKPSGAIEMSSMMSVDAFVARSGLKMVNTLHTSTEVNGQLSVQDSQVVLGKIHMPRDKIEIVSLESKFFIVHRESEREQKMLVEDRYTKSVCTGNSLKKVLGVEVCGELEFPRSAAANAPYFPFTGPAAAKLYINKADTHASYDFEARLQTLKDGETSPIQRQVARLSVNTPGSKVNRELFTDITLNHMDKSLNANLRTPWKKAVMNGAVVDQANMKSASLSLMVDEQHEYSINSHVKINERGNKLILTPTMEVSLAGLPVMSARGTVRTVPGDMANAEVTFDNVFKKPLTLKGGYDKEVRKNGLVRYSSNLEVRTDSPLVKATASVDQRDGLKRTSLDVVYRLAGPRHRVRFNGQMKDAQTRQIYTVNMAGDLSSTQFPMLDHDLKVNMKQQPRHFEVDANLRYGGDEKDNTRRIVISHESNIRNKPNALNMDHTTKFNWKAMNIDVNSKINHRHNNNEIKTNALVVYAPGKKVDMDMHFRKESSSPLVMVADASLAYPGHQMSLHEKLEEKTTGYAHELALQWAAERFTSQGELIISPNNKYDVRLEVTPPRMPSTVLTTSHSFNIDDFHTEVALQHAGSKYMVATSYKYNHMQSAEGKIDVKMPNRHILVTSMAKVASGTYEHDTTIMWDAKRDPSKKLQMNAVVKAADFNKVEGDFNIIAPARKYNMAFNSEKKDGGVISHGEVTWAKGKTASLDTTAKFVKEEGAFILEGTAEFISPIRYLERLVASVKGENNANAYTNNMMVSWAEGQAITTAVNIKKLAGWSNTKSELTIVNPFTHTLRANFNLNTVDNQLTLHTDGQYGNSEKIELDFSGKNSYPTTMEASFKVKTPFRAVRRVGASIDHTLRNGQLRSAIIGFVNKKKVQVAASGKDLSGNNYRDASINVMLKTPFENFEHMSAEIKHAKNGAKYTNTLEGSLGSGKTISASLDFVHQANNQVLINNGNLRITTPFRNAENLFANWAHDIRSPNVKITYDVGVNSQHMKIDLSHMDAASHLMIETPFNPVKNIIIDTQKKVNGDNTKMTLTVSRNSIAVLNINTDLTLAHLNYAGQLDMKVMDKTLVASASVKANDSPYTGHIDFKWNENSKVSLSGDLATNIHDMRGNILFVSPIQGLERLMMTLDHTNSNNRYTSAASFEYAPSRKIQVDSIIDVNAGLVYNLAVKSPCSYLKSLNFQVEHKAHVNRVKAAYNGDNSRFVAEGNLHGYSVEDMNGNIKLTSSMTNDITFTFVNKKAGTEWHSEADFEYAPRQKVEVQTIFSLSPEIKMDLGIKTPFYQFNNAKMSFQHSGDLSRFQNTMSFNMLAAGEKTDFTSSTVVNGLKHINTNIKLNKPKLDLSLNHNMANGNFHTVFEYAPSKKIDTMMTYDGTKRTFNLKTPFAALSEITMIAEHHVAETKNSKFDVVMTMYGKTGKLSGHCNARDLEFLDSLLMLETPTNTMTLIAKHSKISNQWVSTAAISWTPEKTIAMELHFNPEEQEASLSFNSPFQGFEDLHMKGAVKSTRTLKYGKFQFNTPSQQYMTEMRMRHGKKMLLDLKIETPCQYMKNVAIRTSLFGSADDFKASAELSHNLLAGKIDFDASVKAAIDDVDALITFTSPFSGFEDLKLKVNHKEQGGRRYTSSVDAAYAKNKVIQLRSRLGLHSLTSFQGQLSLASPCTSLRSMQMAFNHEGEINNFKTHFEVHANDDKKSQVDLSFQAAENIYASFKAVTPLLENIDFTFTHTGPVSAFETRAELKYGKENILSTANFNGRSGVQLRFTLNTPYTEDLIVSINHQGDLMNFHHDSKVEFGSKNVKLNGAASFNNNVNIQFELETPIQSFKKSGVVFSYKGTQINFNSGLRMFLNQDAIDAKLDFSAEDSIKVGFKLQTPFKPVNHITFDLSHTGNVRTFTSKVMLTYAPKQTITVEGSFNMEKDLNIYLHILSPFEVVDDLTVKFDHMNNRNGWSQDVSLLHNGNLLVDMKNNYKNTHDVEVSSVITTPYELMKEIRFNFDHKKTGQTSMIFNVNGLVTRADVTLKAKQITIRFQSPFPHVNDVTLSATGDMTNELIYGALEFDSDDYKGIKVEAELKMMPEISGRFSIETPFKNVEKHTAAFTYSGSFPNFRAHAEIDMHNIGRMQVDGDLSSSPAVVGQIKIQTPFINAKEYTLIFNHEGGLSNFVTDIKIASKEHFKMEGQASLRLGSNSQGSVSFTSDIDAVTDFSASFTNKGNMQNFVSHAEATCTSCGKIEFDGKVSDTRAEFDLKTPFNNVKKYTLSAVYEATKASVAIKSEEHFGLELNGLLDSQNVAGNVEFTSKMPGIKDYSASFSHKGNMHTFVSHGEATCSGCGKIEVDSKLTETLFNFELKTPFTNVKRYTCSASMDGPITNFASEIQVASQEHFKMLLNTNLKIARKSAGSISFTSDIKAIKDFSASFRHKGNMENFVSHAEATCTGCGKVQIDAKLSDSEAKFELQTPFKNAKKYTIDATLTGLMNDFTSKVIVSSQEHFKMEVNTALKTGHETAGAFSFSSDIRAIKDFSFSFNHNGNFVNFVSHAEATCNNCGTIQVDAKLSDSEAKFELQTPFKDAKKYTFDATLNGPTNNVKGRVVIASLEHFNMEVNTALKIGYEIAGSFAFTSDIKALRDFSLSFNHKGSTTNFVSHAEATCDSCGTIQVDAKLSDSEVKLEIQTPFKNAKKYTIDATLIGPMNDFTSKVIISSQEHFKMEVNTALKSGYENAGSFAFTSDIKAIRDFSASFNHKGDNTNFVSHAEATCDNCGTIQVDAKLSESEAKIEIQTPFKNAKKYTIDATFNGPMNDFTSKVIVSSQEHFKMELNTNLKVGPQSAGSLSFTSDIKAIRDFSISFSHSGDNAQFTTHVEATCAGCGKVEFDGHMMATPLVAEFKVRTPFKNMKEYSMILNHEGPSYNFKTMVKVASKEHFNLEVNTNLKTHGAMSGGLSVTSDLKALKDFSMSFNNVFSNGQFRAHAEATCTGCGKIEVDGDLSLSPAIRGEFKFQSPMKNMKQYSLTFSHDGDFLNFDSQAQFKSVEHATININANLKTVRGLQGAFAFKSNLNAINDFNVAFDHTGNSQQFRSHAEFNCEKWGKVSADADFRSMPSIVGNFHLGTPMPGMENFRLNIKHNGEIENFMSSVEFTYGYRQTIKAALAAKTSPSVDINFKLETPFSDDIDVSMSHNGNIRRFSGSATVLKNKQNEFHYEISFDSTSAVQGSLKIQIPRLTSKDMHVSFKGSNKAGTFKAETTLAYGKETLNAEFELKMNSGIEISLKLNTPWEPIKNVELDIANRLWKRRIQTEVVLNHNNQKYQGKLNLKFKPVVDGELNIKTPLPQVRDITIAINHQGDISDLDQKVTVHHNGEQKFNGKWKFQVSPRIQAAVELSTAHPMVKDFRATIAHSGGLKRFSTHAALSHNGEQKFQGNMKVQTYPSVNAEMKFQTPFSAARDVSAIFSHDGSLQRFHSQGVVNHNGRSIFKGDATFTAQPNINGEIRITTPGNNYVGVLSHEGSLSAFKSFATVAHNGEKKFNTEVTFSTTAANTVLKANAPFVGDVEATLTHTGSAMQFDNAFSLSHNGEEVFNSQVSFKTSPAIEAQMTINNKLCTAFRHFSAGFSHNGNLKNFVTSATATYNGRQVLESEFSFQVSPVLKANFKFETPHTKLQDAGINIKYEGHLMDFAVDASAQYKGEKFIGTIVKFQLEGNTLKTLFNLKTPYTRELNIVYNHEGTIQRFQCHAELNHMKADLNFAVFNGGLTVALKTSQPELLDFSANVKYSMNSIKADLLCAAGKFEFDGSYKQRPMALEFRLATPFQPAREVSFDMTHRGNNRAMVSSLNLKYNGKNVVAVTADFKNYARTVGNVSFKSMIPYLEKLGASFRHEMTDKLMRSEASIAYYNKEISAEANIKFTPKVFGTVMLMTPFNGYKKTSLRFSHVYSQDLVNADATLRYGSGKEMNIGGSFARKPTTLDVSLELNTPFNAVKTVGVSLNAEGNSKNMKSTSKVYLNNDAIKIEKVYREENSLPVEASIVLSTPFANWEQTALHIVDNVEGTRHQPRAVFSWNGQQVQVDGLYNKQRQNVDASVTLTTPFNILRQVTLAGNANLNNGVTTDIQLDYNGNKVLHTQADYKNMANKHSAAFTMLIPHPMKTEVEFSGRPLDFAAKAGLHWDTRHADKKVSTELRHSLEGAKRAIAVRFLTANRITGLKTEFEHSASTFLNKVELIWDEAKDQKISYDISVVAKPTRYHRIYESRARLDTPIRSLEFTLNHRDNGRLYQTDVNAKWDAVRDASRQLSLNNRYENTGSEHMHQLTISHPKMAKDIVLRNQWSMNHNDIIYSGRTEIEYSADASETLVMSTLVQDHSGNYSVELGLSHPQSKLDVKMNSHLTNTPSTFSAAMGLNYMNARRKVNNLSLRGEIEKIRKQLTMELNTPVKKLQLNGKVKETDNKYTVNVVATEDEENQVSAKFNVDTEAQTMDMKAFYSPKNPRNMMHVYGKYIDGKSVVMEATRHHNGLKTVEGQVDVNLKDKHLLHSKVYWRPEALENAKFATKKAMKQTRQDVAHLMKVVQKSLKRETRAKLDDIRRSLPNTKPVSHYLRAEVQSVSKDMRVVRRAATAMFDQNEFYMRTAYRFSARNLASVKVALEQVEQAIVESFQASVRALEEFSDDVAAVAAEAWQVCARVCDEASVKLTNAILQMRRQMRLAKLKYDRLVAVVAQKYSEIRAQVLAKLDTYVEFALNKAAVYAKQAWGVLSDIAVSTQAKIDELISQLMASPRVQRLVATANSVVNGAARLLSATADRTLALLNKINIAAINSVHEVISGHMQHALEALSRRAESFVETASMVFNSVQDALITYVQNAVNHENSRHVRHYMQMAVDKVAATYTEMNVEARTKSLVRDIVMGAVNFVKANSYYIVNDYLHLDENKIIEWNPAGGRLEGQVYIPMEAPTMQTVDFVNLAGTYRRVKAELSSLVPEVDYSPMDTYYKYKPSTDMANWLPPFKAAATIAGRQHYITFDGKHYEFAAPCSYLLARDFVDGNFSMVVNYDGVRKGVSKRSVTVAVSGKEVEIFSDGRFTLDGDATATPAMWGNAEMRLEGDKLNVTDKKGVTVICDLKHDVCTLHVSGWYFGKMAGLFGTYNNEQSDDFTTAEGTKATSVAHFAGSWSVGRCARTRNMARVSNTASSRACSQLFHDKNSPLRPCFRIVDPVNFEAMCVNDVQHTEGAECKIAAAYVSECLRQEVPVELPAACRAPTGRELLMEQIVAPQKI